jgi:O-antigen/teichoic acid export membrane protein
MATALMMQALRARLPKGRLRRAVAVSVSGAALAQLIVLAAFPAVTRLYTPEDFGVLGVFSALLGILGIAVSLRYELAIPIAEDGASVVNLLALSLIVTLLFSLLIGVTLWLLGDIVSAWLNAEALRPLLWLLPVGLLAVGCSRVLSHWAIRHQAFGLISRNQISRSFGRVVTQIGFGFFTLGPFGLLLGQIIGQSAGITTMVLAFCRSEGRLWRDIRLHDMARVAARFRNLPTLATAAALLENGVRLAPALLVAALYGVEVAGWFALAQKVLQMPVFLSTAVARVYLSEAPRRARAGGQGMYALFKATTWRLLAFGVLSLGLVVVAGPQLFALVFGPVWTEAGRFAQVLAFVSLGQLVVAPVSQTLIVLERQDVQFTWDGLRFGALLLVFLAAYQLSWSPLLTIAVLSAGAAICHILLFVRTRQVLLAHLRARLCSEAPRL